MLRDAGVYLALAAGAVLLLIPVFAAAQTTPQWELQVQFCSNVAANDPMAQGCPAIWGTDDAGARDVLTDGPTCIAKAEAAAQAADDLAKALGWAFGQAVCRHALTGQVMSP